MYPVHTRMKGRNLIFTIRKHTKNMASSPIRGGIRAALSSVAGARLSPTPLCQWSQVSRRSPTSRGRSLQTQNFGTTKFLKCRKNMASFPVRSGICAVLSSVVGACLLSTPLGHSLCGAYQWSQGLRRSPTCHRRSLRTKDFGSTKLYIYI